MKKIVVLDGYSVNPGDLSWDYLTSLGNCTLYDRTVNPKLSNGQKTQKSY